jgi:hypothetical protein
MLVECRTFVRYEKRLPDNGHICIKYIQGLQENDGYLYKHIGFNIFNDNESKIPEGYNQVELDNKMIKDLWYNPRKLKLESDNEQYIEISKLYENCNYYYIHDNGRRPFLVYVSDENVNIYKRSEEYYISEDNSKPWMYIDFIGTYVYINKFIGESPKTLLTEFSGGYGEKFLGNSILIQTSNNEYMYIGEQIYSFNTDSPIIKYVSEVGNSDVPYPYAIDQSGKYYLMISNIILTRVPENIENIYNFYYNESGSGKEGSEKNKKIINIDDITVFNTDNNQRESFYLEYHVDAREHYNRPWMTQIRVITATKKDVLVTEEEYVDMMKMIEKEYNYIRLEYNCIHKRIG